MRPFTTPARHSPERQYNNPGLSVLRAPSSTTPQHVREASGGYMYAHAGVVSAATAILQDMETKGILKVGQCAGWVPGQGIGRVAGSQFCAIGVA